MQRSKSIDLRTPDDEPGRVPPEGNAMRFRVECRMSRIICELNRGVPQPDPIAITRSWPRASLGPPEDASGWKLEQKALSIAYGKAMKYTHCQ